MKRRFMILAALTVVSSLWCTSLIAEDTGERSEASGEARIEEIEKAPIERGEHPDEHAEQEGYWDKDLLYHDDRPSGLYQRLFAELERQREENRSLREEVRSMNSRKERFWALFLLQYIVSQYSIHL